MTTFELSNMSRCYYLKRLKRSWRWGHEHGNAACSEFLAYSLVLTFLGTKERSRVSGYFGHYPYYQEKAVETITDNVNQIIN